MGRRRIMFGLLLVLFTSQLAPSIANEEMAKRLVIGAPTPLHLFGKSLDTEVSPLDVFGIVPPCTSEIAFDYRAIPCIRSVQYRPTSSTIWRNANLKTANLLSYVDTKVPTSSPELSSTKWTDNWWYLHGGSASLWEFSGKTGNDNEPDQMFVVEATVSSRVLPKTFSLSLVPVIQDTSLTHDLSDFMRSTLRRDSFPAGYEFQVIIKQSQLMQPLQFVTSRTKDASISTKPIDFIFRGQPSAHSLLESEPIDCSDPVMVQVYDTQCAFLKATRKAIYPWDRSILEFLEDSRIDKFREVSRVSEWSFQGGQDTPLVSDLIMGCGFTNLFSFTSTNAPAYHINPPRWDRDNSSLLFKIANTHTDADSQIQRGYFSIQLRLSSAACMWGVDRNNVNATAEVFSEDGTSQIVTTSTVKIDEETDTIYVNLAGFTFSSPTIKIKLIEKLGTSGMSGTHKSVKKTITCQRGKVQIKVKKPRCPAGSKRV